MRLASHRAEQFWLNLRTCYPALSNVVRASIWWQLMVTSHARRRVALFCGSRPSNVSQTRPGAGRLAEKDYAVQNAPLCDRMALCDASLQLSGISGVAFEWRARPPAWETKAPLWNRGCFVADMTKRFQLLVRPSLQHRC